MNPIETTIDIVWWVVGAAFAVGALLALWRMVQGPTIVDRMVAGDTILTIIICVLGADMVWRSHTDTLPLMLVLAMTAFIASVAVARYVSRQEKREPAPTAEPSTAIAGGGELVPGVLEGADGDAAPGATTPGSTALTAERAGDGERGGAR